MYLDYNATTPVDLRIFEAMTPFYLEDFGNAGSRTHAFGQRAKAAVDGARKQVADVIDGRPEEIVFTSGATESNNLAILGLAQWGREVGRRHIVTTAIEHKSVLEPLARLGKDGFEVEIAPITSGGYVEAPEILRRLRKDTLLVSIMHSNNETGVLQPITEIGDSLKDSEALFHIDAAQTYGKELDALRKTRYDLLSISGHKVYGPKGIGALFARRTGNKKRPITPLVWGGGQELGLRPGTLPVPLIVGLGAAAALAAKEHGKRRKDAQRIRARLFEVLSTVPHAINGDPDHTQPHVLNVRFPGVDSEALMVALRDSMAISNGSACTSASYTPSHVLKAMGLDDGSISSSVRISWGPGVSEKETFRALSDAVQAFTE